METKLQEVQAWAKAKIASGQEPPWAWFQYMKLVETLDAILESQVCTTTENSQQADAHSEMRLRLVDSTYPRGSVQPHPPERPVPLPM
jgi:hypothetical protein